MPITPIPEYTGEAPNRSQSQSDFNTNVADSLAFSLGLPEEINTFAVEANALAVEVEGNAEAAAASEAAALVSELNAQESAETAAATANLEGDWSSLTGALNKPATVRHNGILWVLLNNLANVTTSEPGASADWAKLINGWGTYTGVSSAYPNSPATIETTVAADVAIYADFDIGDEYIVNNSPLSTQDIRLMNPSYTITGKAGAAAAGDNILIAPGETVHIVAKSLTAFVVV